MIAIIGKTPPPIGGVTIYVKRLLDNLLTSEIRFCFIQLNRKNLLLSIFKLRGYSVVHLIASHPFVRLYFSILCMITRKKLIIIYTDNIGEFPNAFYNLINDLSIRLATVPTVLNLNSFEKGKNINKNTRLITSFIPPNIDYTNLKKLREHLSKFLLGHKIIFCTNAFNYCLDKSGNEMYGIISLISIFNEKKNLGLIITDPSGAYNNYLINNKIVLGSNIKLLTMSEFTFIDVINICHCVIRATTTDGDSLSIREALYLNKDVICSDCVDRPNGCILYPTNDTSALSNLIENYKAPVSDFKRFDNQNGFTQIKHIYKELIQYFER